MIKNIFRDAPIVIKTLRTIYRSPQYLLIALFFASIVFATAVWLPNLGLIQNIVTSSAISMADKATFLWGSLGAIKTNFTPLAASLTIIISILMGLNIGVMVYYFKRRVAFQKASGGSVIGLLLSFIGIGCASCGSVVLSSIIGIGATASFVGFLPFEGQEFSLLSIIILLGTLYITAKKISDPLVCGISE